MKRRRLPLRSLPRPAGQALRWAVALGLATTTIAPAAAQTSPPANAQGLASLSEDRLLTELASRGLNDLLEHAFERNQTAPTKRNGIRALLLLRELSHEAALDDADRRARIAAIRRDIDGALAALDDPRLLMRQAALLISQSAERDANALEYWGDSPRLQAELRPTAQTVLNLLDRAIERIDIELKRSATGIRQTDDPAARQYMELDQLRTTARFTRQMAAYYLVLSLDRAGQPRRDLATAAISALQEYDTAESTIQPVVRNRLAKLQIARGQAGDINNARDLLNSVADGKTSPRADLSQQYEARFFLAVAALMERNASAAQQALAALAEWQTGNIPADRAQGADAALSVLRYRVLLLQADGAGGEARRQFQADAVVTLLDLLKQQPALRDTVYERALDRVAADADLTQLDALSLQAIMHHGEQALHAGGPADQPALRRALSASDELLTRTGQAGITDDDLAVAALLRAMLLEKLDQPLPAITAFLDFAGSHSDHTNANYAIDRAMILLQPRLKDRATDANIDAAYGRVLELAVGEPFNRRDLAYALGRFQQSQGNHRAAFDTFDLVPDDSPSAILADYQQIIAIRHLLTDGALDADARWALVPRIATVVERIERSAEAPGVPAEHRALGLQAILLQADIINRDQQEPARALQLLDGFESRVEGSPRRDELLADALFIRIDASMALSRYADAASQLSALLDLQPRGKGQGILQELLQRTDAEFRANRQNPPDDTLRRLAGARATLAARMAEWSAHSAEAQVREASRSYALFAAMAAREAAGLIDEPADRLSALQDALAQYDALAGDSSDSDINVTMGRCAVLFDMGRYEEVQPIYARLLNDRLVGPASTVRDGQRVENELYWEAQYRLLRSIAEMAKQSPDRYGDALASAKAALARLYIMDGDAVGGTQWQQEFERLRAELLPDFNPNASAPSPAASQP